MVNYKTAVAVAAAAALALSHRSEVGLSNYVQQLLAML